MTGKTFTEAEAIGILGERRFLAADKVVAAWNKLVGEHRTDRAVKPLKSPGSPVIKYSEAILEEMAADPGWYVIYDPGLSLRENRAILGTDPARQPCHRRDNDWWWLSQREEPWAAAREKPDYHLLRMEGLFPLDNAARDWDWQKKQIEEMGASYERTPTRIIVNAIVSCFLLNQERFFENTYNFGPEMDADYCFLVVHLEPIGLSLGHWLQNDWGGYFISGLETSVMRKFDTGK